MNKIKVGVFGGARGFAMINQLIANPDAELVAVCDKFQPILDQVKEKSKEVGIDVALYNNFDDFIQHDMDAVVLANYANEHATYAIRCLDAGKHVMSEVLPAETPAQAVALIEAVERTGLVYSYAENYCYMLETFEMCMRYAQGEIGEVVYCEGEYIHDCSSIWPEITYGEKDHWRNRMYPTFYCTHSVGPLITITGLRPVSVVGFEPRLTATEKQKQVGYVRSVGIEMITLENGAVCKSVHGMLKHEPGSINYQVYGDSGMMETGRYNSSRFNLYKESPEEGVYCTGTWDKYVPEEKFLSETQVNNSGHGGADFYPTYFFLQKILGRENGKWCIDVYTAVDMGLCGILAYRSILNGNQPMTIPNFRNKEERDAWRNDNACTTPEVAGDQLLPSSSHEEPELGPEVYEHVRKLWMEKTGQI